MNDFVDDDGAYLRWIERHPHGFVVNSSRPPVPSYLILHRATCRHVARARSDGWSWTRDMSKLCSADRSELEAWARTVGGPLQPCAHCRP